MKLGEGAFLLWMSWEKEGLPLCSCPLVFAFFGNTKNSQSIQEIAFGTIYFTFDCCQETNVPVNLTHAQSEEQGATTSILTNNSLSSKLSKSYFFLLHDRSSSLERKTIFFQYKTFFLLNVPKRFEVDKSCNCTNQAFTIAIQNDIF